MKNNDILRQLRYILDCSDDQLMDIFALAEHRVHRGLLNDWMKKEDHPEHKQMFDDQLAIFLNGLIIHRRGHKEGSLPIPEKRLNNNIILRKLKIAFNLRDDDMVLIFEKADITVSKHEINAFFRNPRQSQYRPCKDQYLRRFLTGLKLTYRPSP